MDADYWGAGDPKWRYGKLRRDLVETIQALHPAFLRFPGGCIVEGVTPGNEYRWKDTVGSLAARRQQYSMWSFKMPDGSSYSQSYQIGFYEYFCLCEDLKAKPLPTLFAGIACQSPGRDPRHMDINSATFRNNVIQDYLDLIEFANGDPESSSWAAVRRDMGHPEPFGLDMIGVGNENFGADYVAKFDMISEAIHERYPDMLCVMSAGLFPFQPAMKRSWDHARALAATDSGAHDSATGDAIIVDEHSYHSPRMVCIPGVTIRRLPALRRRRLFRRIFSQRLFCRPTTDRTRREHVEVGTRRGRVPDRLRAQFRRGAHDLLCAAARAYSG